MGRQIQNFLNKQSLLIDIIINDLEDYSAICFLDNLILPVIKTLMNYCLNKCDNQNLFQLSF